MINPFRALQLSRRLFSRKPAAPRLGPAKRRRSRRITRSIESLEDRTLLAVVLPGGVSSVASTLASFLPGSILTSVNDALAGGNSSALLYAAFDGEANHVRISGSYLNLFLLVDDDPHVPVVRVPPVLNKALLDSFTVDASLGANLGLSGVIDIGVEGEIGVGYEVTPVVGQLVVRASLDGSLGIGIEGSAAFGISLPVIELLGGIPDVQAIVPNPSALGSIFDAIGIGALLKPLGGLFDLVDGISNGFISVPDFSFPNISLPDILDFSSITGVSLPFPLDTIGAFSVGDFSNPFENGFTIPGFDIPIGSQVGDLISTIPGFDILVGIASFFDAIANANETVRVNLLDQNDSADVSTLTLNTEIDGGDGSDTILAGYGDDIFHGGEGDDFFVWNQYSDGDHDSFDGGSGKDVFVVTGTPGDDVFHLFADNNGNLERITRGPDVNNPLAETFFDGWSGVNQIQIASGGGGFLQVFIHGALDLDQKQGVLIEGGSGENYLTLISSDNSPTFNVPFFPDDTTGSVIMDGMTVRFSGVNSGITLDADNNNGDVTLTGNDGDNDIRFRTTGNGDAKFTNDTQVSIYLKDFGNGSNVTLLGEDGDDTISLALGGREDFNDFEVDAGGPTGANTIRFEGSDGDDKFEYTPSEFSRRDGFVQIDDAVDITFIGVENTIFIGNEGVNRLDVQEPTAGADDNIIVRPGSGADGYIIDTSEIGGNILVYGLIDYQDIADLRFQTGTGTDILQGDTSNTPGVNAIGFVNGGLAPGVAQFDFTGFPILFIHDTSDPDILDIEGGTAGDDVFTVSPGFGLDIYINVALGQNEIFYNARTSGGDVGVDFEEGKITQVGFGDVIYTGLSFLDLDANDHDLTVDATGDRNVVEVTPLGAHSGDLSIHGTATLLHYHDADSLLVDGGQDTDVLIVNGSAIDDVINVDGTMVEVVGSLPVAYTRFESVTARGNEGNDQISVVPDANIPFFVNGGLPIGATTSNPAFQGDRLKVDLDGENDLIFHAGPEGDAGTYVVGARAPVSFDEIESIDLLNVGPAGNATVNGTNGDDQVTIIGTGNGNSTVSVNNGPAVVYPNIPTFTLESIGGDDFIAIQSIVNWNVNITVVGGSFTSHTSLRLTTPGTETATFTPTDSLAGTVSLLAAATLLDISGIQQIEYDGQGDNDLVIMQSLLSVNNTFVLVPGNSFDDGSLQMDDLMKLVYQRLGAGGRVSVVGGGGIDELRYDGTGFDDFYEVFATTGRIDMHRAGANLVDVLQSSIEALRLEGFAGDDNYLIHSDLGLYSAGITVLGGDQAGIATDSVEVFDTNGSTASLNFASSTITGVVGGTVSLTGVEDLTVRDTADQTDVFSATNFGAATSLLHVTFNAGGANVADQINVSVVNAASTVAYEPLSGASGRLTRLEGGPEIKFHGFHTTAGGLSVTGGGNVDQFRLVSSDSADAVNVQQGGIGTLVSMSVVGGGARVPVDFTGFESLDLTTGVGNDVVTVDNSSGLVALVDGIHYAGGAGFDTLQLIGSTPADTTYNPGPTADAGTIAQQAAETTQQVFFTGLEPVLVVGTGAGDTLTINGTLLGAANAFNAANAVNFVQGLGGGVFGADVTGLIAVDNFETIEFSRYGTLNLNAGPGNDTINLNHPSVPRDLATMNIDSGDSTSGDAVFVNGSAANDTFSYTPTGITSGTLVRSAPTGSPTPTTYFFTNTESLSIDGLTQGTTDTLVVTTINAVVTPGFTPGSGLVDSFDAFGGLLLDLNYHGMESATVTGTTAVVQGTAANDTVTISAAGVVTVTNTLGFSNSADLSGFTDLIINMLGGDDVAIDNSSGIFASITVIGGDNGGGSDSLVENNVQDVTVTFPGGHGNVAGTRTAGGGGSAFNTTVLGIEHVTLNGANANGAPTTFTVSSYGSLTDIATLTLNGGGDLNDRITVTGTAGPDSLVFTPTSDTTATLTDAGGGPDIRITGFNNTAGNMSLSGGASQDEITFVGSVGADTITATQSGVTSNIDLVVGGTTWVPIRFSGFEATQLDGRQAADTFNVTPGAVPVRVVGGDPVALLPGDFLNVTAGAVAVTFNAGPNADAGSIVVGANAPISFAELESARVTGAGAASTLQVNATNGDDRISLVGTGVQDFTVSVNAGPAVQFIDFAATTLSGHSGNDDFTIDVQVAGLAVTITVDGDLPAAGSDSLSVTGVDGTNDTPNWTPTASDAGTLTIAGLTINVLDTESLTVGGDADNETLTVNGNAGANLIVHTPGAAVDAGKVAVDSLLAISYVNLGASGTVTANGIGGADLLVAYGTSGDDSMAIDFTGADTIDIDLTSAVGIHVDLLTIDIDSYEVRSLAGGDTFNVQAPIQASGTFAVLGGGNGGSSDVLNLLGDTNPATAELVRIEPDAASSGAQDITGLGTRIDSSGIERIRYTGNNTNDTLTVAPGLGDNTIRVDRGSGVDRVTSDSLPQIEFTGLSIFVADLNGGADVATFATAFLSGAVATNYRVLAEANDALVIEGTDGAGNNFTVTDPDGVGGTSAAVRDNTSTVVVTETAGALGRLRINTLGGDDTVTINVGVTDVIRVPITVDGGANSDLLIVRGTPATALTNVIYSPGPATTEGRLQYAAGASTLMTIDFLNLEPVLDLVVAATLTINGTNGANVFNYTDGVITPGVNGLVSVDAYETIEFSNKTTLVLAGLAGDDVFHINNAALPNPTSLTGITIIGGDSTTGDRLIANGSLTAGGAAITDAINFTPTASDAGTVAVATLPIVTFSSTESVTINGQGGNDALTVTTPAGANTTTLTPGSTGDSGGVHVDSLVPLTFTNIGGLGTLTIADAAVGRTDTLIYNGTAANDVFAITGGATGLGNVTLNSQVLVIATAVSTLTVRGLGGDDTFNVTGAAAPSALPFTNINLQGGASSGDVANLVGDNLSAVTVNLGNTNTLGSSVTGGDLDTTFLAGVEVLNLNASTRAITVQTTSGTAPSLPGNDMIEVTPLAANRGTLTANGVAPVLNYTTTGTFTVDALAGNDRLTVNGSAAGETIVVNGTSVTVGTFLPVTYANVEALTVSGHAGSDTFNVTSSASVPYFLVGGDPIAVQPGDRLNLFAGISAAFLPGSESDAGEFTLDGNAPISFDEIESITVDDNVGANDLAVTVSGTNAADDITAIGLAADSFSVSVNAGPAVVYTGAGALTLDGLSGSDRFTVDVNTLALANPAPNFTVIGRADSSADILKITGTAAADTPAWTPTAFDAGRLTVGGQTVTVQELETLVYDGENQNDTLQVNGNAEANRMIHAPDEAIDGGMVLVDSLLPIRYQHLGAAGTVVVNGNGGIDALVAIGSPGDDTINVDFTGVDAVDIDLITDIGVHVDLLTIDVDSYEIHGRFGDDTINVQAGVQATGLFYVFGGGDGSTDVLNLFGVAVPATIETVGIAPASFVATNQDVIGLKSSGVDRIDVSTIERIRYSGDNTNDSLRVNPGAGNNTVRVDRFTDADRVTSNNLPLIDFTGLATFILDADVGTSGADVITFVTRNLAGAIPANYQLEADNSDTLIIEGVDGSVGTGNDTYTVSDPSGVGGSSVRIVDANGGGVNVTETSGGLGRLQINTLGGDDRVTVDVGSTDLVRVPITFDGGANSDMLIVRGTPATPVTNVLYAPGPDVTEGRLTYSSVGTVLQTIDFVNLEPIIDLVPSATLTVNGTHGANEFSYVTGPNSGTGLVSGAVTGLVSVDAFETIEFANKVALTLIGLAGDDLFKLDHPGVPASLTTINVLGGESTTGDRVVVDGTSAADTFSYTGTGPYSGILVRTAPTGSANTITHNFTDIEAANIDARGGADTLLVTTPHAVITPGFQPGAGFVEPFDLFGAPLLALGYLDAEDVTVTGERAVIQGTAANDIITVTFDGIVRVTNTLGFTNSVNVAAFTNLIVNMLGGDDQGFNFVAAGVFDNVTWIGGENGPSGDTLTEQNVQSATVTFPSSHGQIDGTRTVGGGGGAFQSTVSGIENVILNGANNNAAPTTFTITGYGLPTDIHNLTLNGGGDANDTIGVTATAGPDLITFTPLSATSATLERNADGSIVHITGFNNTLGNLTLDGVGSQDSMRFVGSAGNDTITAQQTGATSDVTLVVSATTWVPIRFTGVEATELDGQQGNDTFNLNSGAVPVFVDGGDPIAVGSGDRLNLLAGSTSVFTAGPEADAGAFVLDSNAAISFDHIETITVDDNVGADNLAVTVLGTNGDDDITMQGTATNAYTVSVNAGPATQYTGSTTLFLQGQSGDDDIDVDVNVAALGVTITVDGDLPNSTGDELTVTGVDGSNDTPVWTPLTADSGTLTLAGITINVGETELFLYNGESDNDTLTVNGTAGDDVIVHTPGSAIDAGTVRVNSLLGVRYESLGATGTITIVGNGQTTADTLVARGTDSNDIFNVVATTGTVDLRSGLGNHVDLITPGIEQLTLDALAGDDVFNVTGSQPYAVINLLGGSPSASDIANVTGSGAAAMTTQLGNTDGTAVVTGGGIALLNTNGVEVLNLDTAGANLTVTSTTSDDLVIVTPLGTNNGTLTANGVAPVLNYSSTATFSVNLAGGNDQLVVQGSPSAETIEVDGLHVTVGTRETVNYTGAEALTVRGAAGSDTFNVTSAAAIPIFIDGGDPIAVQPGDRLNLLAGSTSVFTSGPEADAGAFVLDGNAAVSFDHIESITVDDNIGADNLAVTVLGTNGDDDITMQGTATNAYTVSVNAGPATQYTGSTTLSLQGQSGDDDIDLDVNVAALGVTITVDGDLPNSTGDELTVTGVDGSNDTPVWTPLTADSGTLTLAGITINVGETELFLYNGESDNDTLTVNGTAGDDVIVHTPGSAIDAGTVRVNSLLGVRYESLGATGTITIAGNGQTTADTLVARGTDSNDTLSVAASTGTVNLVSLYGDHVDLIRSGLERLTLDALAGDDTFNIGATHGYTIIDLWGGSPSASDVANVTGNGTNAVTTTLGTVPHSTTDAVITGGGLATVNLSGVEVLNIDSAAAAMTLVTRSIDDLLTVTPLTASGGTAQANGLIPVVNYTVGGTFTVDLGTGNDQLLVNGSASNDLITATATTVTVTGRKAVTYSAANLETLEIDGLAGDDRLDVDNSTGLVALSAFTKFDGGVGNDLLRLIGSTTVTSSVYNVGPGVGDGSSIHTLGATVQKVFFTNLEPVIDIVASANLTVNATNSANSINLVEGPNSGGALAGSAESDQVSIDGFEPIEFANKTTLIINGLAGNDTVNLNDGDATAAAGLTGITVNGGDATTGDLIIVNDSTPGTAIVFSPTATDAASVAAAQPVTVTITTTEHVTINGLGGNDTLRVVTPTGLNTITLTPGATVDAGDLRVDSLVALDFLNLGATGTVDLTDSDAARIDTFIYNGTGASDVFSVLATSGSVRLNSQVLVTTPGISRLVLNALEGDDATTINYPQPYNGSPNMITVNGGGPGGSDSLTIIGAVAAVDAFTVTPSTQPHNGAVLVNAVNNLYTGIEHLFLTGNAGDSDTLLVNDDGRDNTWNVSAGTVGDLVQVDGRESIDYNNFRDVTLTNGLGTDLFRVWPTNLTGYTNSLTINGDATGVDDVLEVYGTPAADTVTTTANVITTNSRPVTAGVNLVELKIVTLGGNDTVTVALSVAGARNVIDLGAGNDTLTATTSSGVAVYAGEGDDSITASNVVDTIYGDAGNDTILALDGNDLVYAGTGNDSITGGVGNDNLFGGDGSDRFVWNNGDNSDIVEGDDGVDVQIVNGAAAGDIFNLRTATNNQARSFFERTNLVPFTIDMGQIEQVDINGLAGADQVAVRDLSTTEIRQVNVDVGTAANLDTVTVDGRTVSDSVTLTALTGGVVNIAGLKYDVNVSNLNSTADLDTLTFNANEGDDTVVASDGLNAIFGTTLVNANHLTINGGEGDDVLTGFGQLNGGTGNDTLNGGNFAQSISGGDGSDSIFGGRGDDVLNGDAGEDSFIGGLGNDTIDGGADWDAILVNGTSGADVIDVNQTTSTTLVQRVNATTETDTLVLLAGVRTVEEARVDAGNGADTIRVRVTDSAGTNLIDAAVNSLQMTVHGGAATGAGDRLIVVDDGPADHSRDDLTIYRKDQDDSSGRVTIGPGNPEAFENVFDGIERVQFVDGSGAAVSAEPGSTSRLVVFKHDPFEYNDDRFVATHIGANSVVNVDPSIDPGSVADPFGDGFAVATDVDWYRIEAVATGTLDIQAFFEEIATIPSSGRPGLPNNGDLQIEIYDADGFVNGVPLAIAGNGPNFGINNGAGDTNNDGDPFAENERIRIPAVQGQIYYLRVFGATAAGVTAINNYNLTLINEAPPTPFDLELADNLTFLTGSQEAPVSVVTNASGTANFQYNAIANTFDLDLFVTGVELTNLTGLPELTAAHIHSGAVGVAGPVLVTLPGAASWSVEPAGIRLRLTGAAFSGAAGDIAALLAGNTYFNIHTTANAGGEIRGQIQIPNVLGVTDSGRSQLDNTTNDNTPTIFLRVDDAGLLNDVPGNAVGVVGAPPVDEVIAIPHNSSTSASPVGLTPGYRVAIYDEGDTHAPVLLGFAQPVANLRGVYSFTFPNALTDGSHFLSAKLQMIDPADNDTAAGTQTRATGFGPRSQSLEIIVDTVAPPVFFGAAAIANDGLIPDQGVIPQPAFFVDNKTNDQTPTFWGTAEANTVIRVFADLTPANGVDNFDLLVGLTVTLPTDGTNQFPNGQWRVTSTVDFNNPAFFPVDGLRRLLVTAEDLAGNLKSGGAAQALDIFLDTQGAQVTNVQITSALTYDLFDPKPSLGPTPRTDGLTISFRDFPIRTAGFPNPAVNPIVAVNPGHYVLRGDANGIIPISSITFVGDPSVPGSAATGRVLLTFPAPLLDDRYTLTVNDGVVDDVGNKLDGESNAIQPLETPGFPSGDGQPGGDFVARFTIDSRSEIGAVGQGGITIDINGNMHFDPTNTDFVNRDLVFEVGLNTDRYIAGKFNPAAAVIQDGFDRIAAYGLLNRQYRWLIDFNNDGRPDYSAISGLQINATPISGDFNPAHVGDEIGLFDGKKWYFDTNGNNNIDAGDRSFTGNLTGVPITGDFDGDGKVDLAVHNAQLNLFSFDLTSTNDGTLGVLDGNADYTISFDNSAVPGSQTNLFPGVLERPFAGDFNLDGITDIGLMVPNRDGASPSTSTAEFYIFQSIAAAAVPGTAAALNHQFSPKPLGVDLYAQFGSNVSVPLVGNFDPPVTPTTSTDPIPTPLEITLPSIGGTFTVLREGDNLHVRNAKGDDLIAARPMDGISNVRIVGGKAADVVVLDSSLSGFAEIFQFEGGNGADRLDASRVNFAVTFDGGAGNDTFLGGGGDDVFLGGTGDDIASGGSGNDLLDGGDGNDALTGNDGADNLLGGAGNDRLDAGNGNDVLNGQAGNDVLLGGADDDLLTGDAGNDAFDGGAGTDRIVESGNVNLTISSTGLTGLGTDTFLINTLETASLTGGAGNNTLTVNGFQGSVTLVGGPGNDVLTGGVGDDSLDGGDGTDLLIVTGATNAVLTNVLLTGTGNDVLSQIELVKLTVSVSALTSNIDASDFTGNVTLIGGNGADTLKGGRGNDSILGGAGNDDLRGGAGLDTIDGGAGNDNLRGDDGNDKLLGSTGNDTILGGADNDSIDGGADDDVLLGEDGNDTILGGTGDRASDTLGSRGDDIIIGGAGNDVLSGQDGNDTIFGGTGDDKLSGGNGSDTLSGEDGIDTLAGDAGSDALFGGADLDVFTKPAVGEVNENGVFNDAVFFTRLDALLSAIP